MDNAIFLTSHDYLSIKISSHLRVGKGSKLVLDLLTFSPDVCHPTRAFLYLEQTIFQSTPIAPKNCEISNAKS